MMELVNFVVVLAWIFFVVSVLAVIFTSHLNVTENQPLQVALRGGYEIHYHNGRWWLVGLVCIAYLISYYLM